MYVPIPLELGQVSSYVAVPATNSLKPQCVVPSGASLPLPEALLSHPPTAPPLQVGLQPCFTSDEKNPDIKSQQDLLHVKHPMHGVRGQEAVKKECRRLTKEIAERSLKSAGKANRWWTLLDIPLTCPLTGFPIHLLPYPPFKLRVHEGKVWPHVLVDGRFLALQLITTGNLFVHGRCLTQEDVLSLSQYMYKCKLGRFRPEVAVELAKKADSSELSEKDR